MIVSHEKRGRRSELVLYLDDVGCVLACVCVISKSLVVVFVWGRKWREKIFLSEKIEAKLCVFASRQESRIGGLLFVRENTICIYP